jgi:YfiH family protein
MFALLTPDWPAPPQVRACVTTRAGGVSLPPYAALNLATHVGDAPDAVAENRRRLVESLDLPTAPRWLSQVHGTQCVDAATTASGVQGDASYALRPGLVCAVLTADCLPVLLCDRAGSRVAAVHAGWRGLRDGVVAAALRRLDCPPRELLAWIGPGIGTDAYVVGAELRRDFLALDHGNASCFEQRADGWHADLAGLAERQLASAGVTSISSSNLCTLHDERFYSYRRDGVTGRFASLVWLASPPLPHPGRSFASPAPGEAGRAAGG